MNMSFSTNSATPIPVGALIGNNDADEDWTAAQAFGWAADITGNPTAEAIYWRLLEQMHPLECAGGGAPPLPPPPPAADGSAVPPRRPRRTTLRPWVLKE